MSQCMSCGKPLTVEINPEEEEEEDYDVAGSSGTVIPDSVELQCGCHFHWCVILCISRYLRV